MLQLRSRSSYLVKEENENVQCLLLRGNSGALLDFNFVCYSLTRSVQQTLDLRRYVNLPGIALSLGSASPINNQLLKPALLPPSNYGLALSYHFRSDDKLIPEWTGPERSEGSPATGPLTLLFTKDPRQINITRGQQNCLSKPLPAGELSGHLRLLSSDQLLCTNL